MTFIRVLTAAAVSALVSTAAFAGGNDPIGGGLNLGVTFAATQTNGNGGGEVVVKDAKGNTTISNFAGVESVASITPNANCNCNTDLSLSFAGASQSVTTDKGVDFAKLQGGGSLEATNIVATGNVSVPAPKH